MLLELPTLLTVSRNTQANGLSGPYGFVLKNRRPLPFIKWTGGLGLRDAPKRLLNRISQRTGPQAKR